MRIVWSMEFAQWGMCMLLLCSCQPSLCFVFVDAYWLVVVCCFHFFCVFVVIRTLCGWLGNRVVSVLDSDAEGPGFKSQSRCCWVTVLGKLFTPVVPLFTKQQLIVAHLRVAGVTAGLAEVMAAYCQVYDSRHLQADCQELGSAPEPYAR